MFESYNKNTARRAIQEVTPYAVATLLIAGQLLSPESSNAEPISPTPIPAEPAPISPIQLASRIDQLISPSVDAWSYRQSGNGQFKDPVKGRISSYGPPMLAQAMIEKGVSTGDQRLINIGLNAEKAQISHPDKGGFNVGFEVLGLTDAVKQNDTILANNGQWQTLRGPLTKFIASRYNKGVESKTNRSSDLSMCMANPDCFYNLKLVGATASIDYRLSKIGINPKLQASFRISNPAGKTTKAKGADNSLLKQAAELTSDDAKESAWAGDKAGILSDPGSEKSNNPLAYNALCAMMLGHAVEAQGYNSASREVKGAFERTTKSIVGYMAPNGETSYIGRGQGQVWEPAIALNALTIAAKHSKDPVWKGRYLTASSRIIDHLETAYTPNSALGLPLAPRLKDKNAQNTSYNGLDYYASYNMYEGLALFGLRKARDILKTEVESPFTAIGSDIDSTFIDPSQAKFATIKKAGIWYAVHGGDALPDARYDFGIVAAQKMQPDGTWTPVMPHRPHTNKRASSGGAIKINGKTMLPTAQKIVNRGNGKISMYGGWSSSPGGKPTLDRSTKWTFTPEGSGVNMSFRPKHSRKYEFTAWYEAGSRLIRSSKGLTVIEPSGRQQIYSFNKPVSIHNDKKTAYSAYDNKLKSSRITLKATKGSQINMTTSF